MDGIEKKYIEEVGTMNVFFKINGEVLTPSLEGSIFPGVTRDSVIQLLKSWNRIKSHIAAKLHLFEA